MLELSQSERLKLVLRNILISPLSLAIIAAGGAGAVLLRNTGLPLTVGVGIAAFAVIICELILVYRRLNNEQFLAHIMTGRKQAKEQVLSEEKVEELLSTMDFETRQQLRYILQLKKELEQDATSKDVADYARAPLDQIAENLNPLMQRALQLGKSKQGLTRYLNKVDERSMESYCTALKKRIAGESDAPTREQLEQALAAREAELVTYRSIEQAHGRIDGQIENLEATLASWKARVIRIKTVDEAGAAAMSEGLSSELESLTGEIDLLDRSVTEALGGDAEKVNLHQQGMI